MEIDILELLGANPILLVFTVLGIGYLVGNIRILGNALGPTVGVLLIGLVFGHFGLTIAPMVGTFGFALFIFSVGLQAGPSFFSAFLADGPRYLILSVVVAGTGVALIALFSQLAGLDAGYDAGLFAGALTSTPSLAGARDAFRAGLGNLGDLTPAQAMQNVSVGYAITYLGGTLGTIALVRYIPKLAGIDLAKEAADLERERGLAIKKTRRRKVDGPPVVRAYRVEKPTGGRTLGQRLKEEGIPAVPLRVKRGKDYLDSVQDLELEADDVVSVLASVGVQKQLQERLGAEVLESGLLDHEIVTSDLVVLNKDVIGNTLSEQQDIARYGCFLTAVMRSGIELPLRDGLMLNRGDRMTVTGEAARVKELAKRVGYIDKDIEETDLVTFSFGIAGGVLLGLITIKVSEISIGLGMAGGLLIMGILIGSASSVNPTFGRVPRAARYLLRELGLMLFMAQVGLSAGGGIIESLASVGFVIVLMGLAITLIPAIVAYVVGRRLLKMNAALLLGSVTGAMTSTPALGVVNDMAKSHVPALGYAGTYTIANVLLTFAGTVIAAF